ncbi:hypothetical protein BDV59DRAFT_176379 [Aspergillus ambiguus]|uniref:uncharacterized protein n=1 Tax=Aspergillus ambiguus TaxID=176160 RepID=UPI003CCDE283
MPLFVPGMVKSDNATGTKDEWMFKLAGKKISESANDVNSFPKKDLPESHRILNPGDPMTMDHRPDRLNVHLDKSGIVHDVNFG